MKKSKYILISLLSIIFVFILISDKHISLSYENNEELYRKMLIDTAESYLRKGNHYQYDLWRENRYLAPESINDLNNSYAVCSTFVFQVYYNSLGIVIPFKSSNYVNYASKLTNNNYVKQYVKEGFDLNSFLKEAYELKPGDIIVFGFGSNGHTTMVYSVSGTKKNPIIKLIHNNGEVYDENALVEKFETKGEKGGSIYIDDLKDLITRSYMNNNKLVINNINTIRIIDGNNYNSFLTDSNKQVTISSKSINTSSKLMNAGKVRYKYKSMDFNKTYNIIKDDCTKSKSLYVDKEEYIEYIIEIKNNSNEKYQNMSIIENIDTSKVDFISSSDGKYSNGKISFTVDVNPKSTKIISYKVKVKSTVIGGTIVESIGSIDNYLDTKKIQLYVGVTLNDVQKQKIVDKYKNISFNSNDNTGKDYVIKLYKSALNYDFTISNNILKANENVIYPVNFTELINNKDIVLGNLYGLQIGCNNKTCTNNTISSYFAWRYQSLNNNGDIIVNNKVDSFDEYNNRPRIIFENMLESGDIIYCDGVAFIYIDGKIIKNGIITYENNIDTFLQNIIGKKFVILRPSLSNNIKKTIYSIEYKTNEENVTNMPSTTTYFYSLNDKCVTNLSSVVPKRLGYTFNGWKQNNNVWPSNCNWKKTNKSNYTLYTTWKPNDYYIKYDLNGASGKIDSTKYTYNEIGTTNITNIIPEKDGYTFSGWSRNKDDIKGTYASSTAWKLSNAGNYTLYAIWIENNKVDDSDIIKPSNDVVDIKPQKPDDKPANDNNTKINEEIDNYTASDNIIENVEEKNTTIKNEDTVIQNNNSKIESKKNIYLISIIVVIIIMIVVLIIKKSKKN